MRMSKGWRHGLLAAILVVGCAGPASPAPPGATQGPVSPPATTPALPSQSTTDSLEALIASMQAAVQAGDKAAYLALVDLSDPVFALEHTRWANDWSGSNPVRTYSLQLVDLVMEDHAATGRLVVTWALAGDDGPRTASFAVRFTLGESGWRYAGEAWASMQVPHFLIRVAPGLEHVVPVITPKLPGVYGSVTTELGYEPAAPLEIKLYADAPALVANTLLSLPDIRGWNEPGEALKLRFDRGDTSLPGVIAHELTHFVLFDRAGTQRTRMPWWLDEGVATFVAEVYEGRVNDDRLAQVIAWQASGELATWSRMAVFEETPLELWQFVYPQGYAMVRYVTERYGEEARNGWLAAMATEMDIDHATPAVLDVSFDELDTGFREWLRSQ